MPNNFLHGPLSTVVVAKPRVVKRRAKAHQVAEAQHVKVAVLVEPARYGMFAFVGHAVEQFKKADAKVRDWSMSMPWSPFYQRITRARR